MIFAKNRSLELFLRMYHSKNCLQDLIFQPLYPYYSRLLNKIRDLLNPTLEKVGRVFASTGVSANGWTCLSFCALTYACGIVYATRAYHGRLFMVLFTGNRRTFLLLIGGFFDIVRPGVSLGRAKTVVSKGISFLDSTGNRISESVIFIGIASRNLLNQSGAW